MTSAARQKANRRNAQRSTGPRSHAGKKRVAHNALRHGLAVPIAASPKLEVEAAELADLIAGSSANGTVVELSRRSAEAQIDLNRIRSAKLALLSEPMGDPDYLTKKATARQAQLVNKMIEARGDTPALRAFLALLSPEPEASEPDRVAAIFADLAPELAKLDRYERRALSRRKNAIRALDRTQCR